MPPAPWIRDFPAAITVCDPAGVILELNEKAGEVFRKEGGAALVGRNLLDCHPGPAREKVERMLRTREKNCYTIEKNGVKKLIFQSPWFQDGEYRGFVEISMEIPREMPHFVRKG